VRVLLAAGCLWAALAVLLGAFGAHALQSKLSPERLAVWETAVRYQMYAALGMQLAALHRRSGGAGARLLFLGSVVFSGSLYLLCLSGVRWLGAITPLGGLGMIGGWVLMGMTALRSPEEPA
jgi:uncharacterized membrane protein YgdD (TMEM256/DUF423 family)